MAGCWSTASWMTPSAFPARAPGRGKNGRHLPGGLRRQSVFGRWAGFYYAHELRWRIVPATTEALRPERAFTVRFDLQFCSGVDYFHVVTDPSIQRSGFVLRVYLVVAI
jgi:hypothetical protein